MDNEVFEKELRDAGIHVTAIRLLVWKTIRTRIRKAFCLADIEDLLVTADRSSIFRALTLFADAHLLHLIDDGSASQKYCVCHCDDKEHHHGHVHLTCIKCNHTWCLEDIEIPHVPVPNDFVIVETEYVIKGICPKCHRGISE